MFKQTPGMGLEAWIWRLLHFDWSDVADDRQIRRYTRCDESRIPQVMSSTAKLATTRKGLPIEVWRRHFRLLDWTLSSVSHEWKRHVGPATERPGRNA